jgi:ABC-type transport system substrate-binding protein
MLNTRRVLGFSLCFLCLSAANRADSPYLKKAEEKPRSGGTLRIKAYQAPFNPVFDPALPSHYFIVEQLYDGLVKFDNNFGIIPGLAEYWTISDDGKTITFYLRKGVKFHNGREVTAEDVKFSLERLVQKRSGSTCYQYFISRVVGADEFWEGTAKDVEGFRVVDDHTFEIRWIKPYASGGLYLLGMYYCKVLPKDLLLEKGEAFFQAPVGTGPFKFAGWLRDPRSPKAQILGVRLERNPSYFGKVPYLDALEYSPNFTQSQFEDGDVDIMPVLSESLLQKKYQVLMNSSLRSACLALSCRIPPLDRAEVRRALALGIDKSKLAEAAYTPAAVPQVMDSYIPPVLPGFFPKDTAPAADPEEARALLGRLLPATGGRMSLTLVFPLPKQGIFPSLEKELRRQLDALHISLDVRYLKNVEDIRDVRTPYLKFLEWDMEFPDPENIVLPLYGSRSPVNQLNSRYASPALDSLLEQSAVEASWEKRTSLFRQMEQILSDDVPSLPLYLEWTRIALLPRVRGAKLPALGFYFLDTKDIWLEERDGSGET